MVFHGASRGCGNCRKRKQKCDLAWPQCGRCARRGVDCPGPTVDAAVWRNSTITAGNQRRNEPTASSSRSGTSEHAYQERILDWVSDLPEGVTSTPSMYTNSALGPSWSEVAYDTYVPRLLRCARESRLTPPFMAIANCLNQGGGHRVTHLGSAISAVSLQTLAFEQPDLNIPHYHAMENYGRAIRSLHRALYDSKEAISSESLVSTMLLSLYGLQASNPSAFVHYDSHIDGMLHMLKLRRQSQEAYERSRTLNYGMRCMVLINYLLREKAMPAELEEEEGFFGNDEDIIPNSWDTIYLLGVRLAALRGKATPLPNMNLAEVEDIFKEVRTLHMDLKRWHADLYGGPISTSSSTWEVHVNTSSGPVSICTLSWYRLFQIFTLKTATQCLERKIVLQNEQTESLALFTKVELAAIKTSLRQQIVGICVCVCSYSRRDGVGLTNDQVMPGGFLLSSGWVMQSTMLSLSKALDDNGQSEWLLTRVRDITGENSRIVDRLRHVQQSMSKPPSEVG